MRRTRERLFTAQATTRGLSSGLLIFEGEDLDIMHRTKYLQKTHKQQFDQQVREKKQMQITKKEEESKKHQEYMQLNTLFGQMEQDYRRKYRTKLEDIQSANQSLAKAKREQQRRERQAQIEEDNKMLEELNRRRSMSLKPGFSKTVNASR